MYADVDNPYPKPKVPLKLPKPGRIIREIDILNEHKGFDPGSIRNFVGIDPGNTRLVTCHSFAPDQKQSSEYFMTRDRYRRHLQPKRARPVNKDQDEITKVMKEVSGCRTSVLPKNVEAYEKAVASIWTKTWTFQSRKVVIRYRLLRAMRKQATFDRTINEICKLGGKHCLYMFGNGGEKGEFSRIKGGIKMPTVSFRKALSKRVPLVSSSEFRTSKLCKECGRVLMITPPANWVPKPDPPDGTLPEPPDRPPSYHRPVCSIHGGCNRDTAACEKIGLRLLYSLHLGENNPSELQGWHFGSDIPTDPKSVDYRTNLSIFGTDVLPALFVPGTYNNQSVEWEIYLNLSIYLSTYCP